MRKATNSTSTPQDSRLEKASKTTGRVHKKAVDGERRVERVIFGDIRFVPWYPSWYPKELSTGEVVIKELYVCPRCFAYSAGADDTEVRAWLRHWRTCRHSVVPGEKIYVHGTWAPERRNAPTTRSRGGAKGSWSIWEVDGAIETLFCQNLSLFAKLFLDTKSVFFDVASFNYFLLVHTPPVVLSSVTESVPRIIGFFSKEKLSWDKNNLACILVFPPWQSKGFGSLLIGVSYAIARREGIMGGPERPISELGMKSYHSYWGKEISRFLLHWNSNSDSKIDIETISQATWISPDDCLAMLKEMDAIEHDDASKNTLIEPETEQTSLKWTSKGEQYTPISKALVHLDKQRVRDWITRKGIKLERSISEEGFKPGYKCHTSRRVVKK
ncbi:hypothetical protein K3495_g793 [Podosphaera aphanis]|nr:hypothetical protein K3495_g793 [Podosphaera aphanis]